VPEFGVECPRAFDAVDRSDEVVSLVRHHAEPGLGERSLFVRGSRRPQRHVETLRVVCLAKPKRELGILDGGSARGLPRTILLAACEPALRDAKSLRELPHDLK
jgi:hypothetical protein